MTFIQTLGLVYLIMFSVASACYFGKSIVDVIWEKGRKWRIRAFICACVTGFSWAILMWSLQ